MLASELMPQIDRLVELRFRDGYAAVVKLLLVQPEEEPHALIYDVVTVLNWGPLDPSSVDLAAAHAASIQDLMSWRPVSPDAP